MTRKSAWLRAAHRAHTGLTVAVVVTLLILNLTDVLRPRWRFDSSSLIEVPLILVFAAITFVRFREPQPDAPQAWQRQFLDRLGRRNRS